MGVVTFYKALLAFWLGSLVFHSAGFHLLPVSVVGYFSGLGFFNDVLLLRADPNRRDIAEAYAGHMIISALYMFASIPLLAVVAARDVLARLRLNSAE